MKYFIIAFILHGIFFFNMDRTKTLGAPDNLKKSKIPISYNTVSVHERIDGMKMKKESSEKAYTESAPKEIEKKKEKISEPEIKSKISQNKKNEVKKQKQNDKSDFQEKKDIKRKKDEKVKENNLAENGNFTLNSDGTYTAVSSKGINFEIIHQIDPSYPRQAEIARYNQIVKVEVKFLVNLEGYVEDIKILKSHNKFGFDKEVISALKKWKFKPIKYNGKGIKVYFNKEFVFTPK